MFDATKGHAIADEQLEKTSDQIAADVQDFIKDSSVSRATRQALLDQIAAVVASRDTARQFAAGEYSQAQANNGSPAAALGSGSTGTANIQAAYQVLATQLPDERKQLMQRLLISDPTNADYLRLEPDGTPSEIVTLRREATIAQQKLSDAERELRNERDESVRDSLAQQLKVANSAALPLDVIKKADVKPTVDKLSALSSARQSRVGGTDTVVPGAVASELKAAHTELVRLTS